MRNKRKLSDREGKTEGVDEEDGEKDAKVAKVGSGNNLHDSGSCGDVMCNKRKHSDSDGKTDGVDEEGGERDAKVSKVGSENNLHDSGSSDKTGPSSSADRGSTDTGIERAGDEGSNSSRKGSEEGEKPGEESNDGNVAKEEPMHLTVMYNKVRYDVNLLPSSTMRALKEEIEKLSGIPYAMQKLIYKGCGKSQDGRSLRDSGLEADSKIMLVGSTIGDVMKVISRASQKPFEDSPRAKPLPLCQQEPHLRVLKDGVPEDAMPGILNAADPLPDFPLTGMLDKHKRKVRLTFQLDLDEVWISTKESTDKIPMEAIEDVKSEPIEGHEEYHIVGFELGATEGSRYWIYWVPAQYVEAIKDAILGELGRVEGLFDADG